MANGLRPRRAVPPSPREEQQGIFSCCSFSFGFGVLTLLTLYIHFMTKDSLLQSAIQSTFGSLRYVDSIMATTTTVTRATVATKTAKRTTTAGSKARKSFFNSTLRGGSVAIRLHDPPFPTQEEVKAALPKEDGPKIAFFSFADPSMKPQDFDFFFASLETWLTDGKFFIAIPREAVQEYHQVCEENKDKKELCETRIHLIVVNCAEIDMVYGSTCYVDSGLRYLGKYFPQFDYYTYLEQDVYVRTKELKEYLSRVAEASSSGNTESPTPKEFVVTTGGAYKLGLSRFDGNLYDCADGEPYLYPWTNPVIFNRRAMISMRIGFEADIVGRIGRKFSCYSDVAMQILLWTYSMSALRVPIAQADFNNLPMEDQEVRSEEQAYFFHGVFRSSEDNHLTMQLVHKHYQSVGAPDYDIQLWHKVKGFHKTKTYKKYGNPRSWTLEDYATIPLQDCNPEPQES